MLGPEEQKKLNIVTKTHWFIYLSFSMALVMYTFVVYVVVRGSSLEPSDAGALKPLFVAISVVMGMVKFWIQSRLLGEEASYSKCRNLDEIIGRYQSYNFIMLALCEAPALLGLVITFMTRRIEEWWLFFGISAVLFITSAPRAGRLESIAESQAARHPQ